MSAETRPVRLWALIAMLDDEVVFGNFVAGSPNPMSRTCDQAGFPARGLTAATDVELTRHDP